MEVDASDREVLRSLKLDQVRKGVCHIILGSPEPTSGVMYLKSFPIPKATPGKYRDTIDGTPLNRHLQQEHFKGEGVAEYLQTVRRGDFQLTTDFEDFLNHAKLAETSWPLSRTTVDGTIYEYSSVTFGFHCSPIWLNELTKPMWALLRTIGIRFAGQCDDWSWMGGSYMDCLASAQVGLAITTMLGWVLSRTPGKLNLEPRRKAKHLRVVTDCVTGTVYLQRRRVRRIEESGKNLLKLTANNKPVPLRQVASFVGMLAAAEATVTLQRARTFELLQLIRSELANGRNWKGMVTLSPPMISRIVWWQRNIRFVNGAPFERDAPTVEITEDASTFGWGGVLANDASMCWGF